MAEKKSIFKAPAKKSAPKEIKSKSDKELVFDKYPGAECVEMKNKFVILSDVEKGLSVSGLCKSESDAWKLAAHNL